MRDCWEVLGIEPTNDIRVIKKAYAQLLKNEVTDEDISTFQKIKEAFDEAIKRAKSKDLEVDSIQGRFTEELFFENDVQQKIQDDETDSWLKLEEALQKLIANSAERKQITNWQSFFWEQDLMDFEKFQLIRYKIKNILLDQYYLFSREVNEYLIETYQIEDITHEDQLTSLKQAIFFPLNLPEQMSDELKNKYYHLRYRVYECLKNNQMLEIERLLKECKMIDTSDPDLITLEGIYVIKSNYYQKRDLKRADVLMRQALELDPAHHTAYLYHVFLTATDEDWKKRKKNIKEALTSYYLFDSALILGFVYAVLEDYEESSRYFFQVPDYLRTTFYKQIRQVFRQREEVLYEMGTIYDIQLSKKRTVEMAKLKKEKVQLEKQKGGFSAPIISISLVLIAIFAIFSTMRDTDKPWVEKNNFQKYQFESPLNGSKNIGMSNIVLNVEEDRERYGVIWEFIYEYLGGKSSEKQAFITTHVDSSYQEIFEKNAQGDIYYSSYSYISYQKMENGEKWYLLSTSIGRNQLIVQVNGSNQIIRIYGQHWENISEQDFDEMAFKILRNYEDSAVYLTDYFLYYEDEQHSVLTVEIYISLDYYPTLLRELKQLEQKGIDMKDFHGGKIFSSYLNNGEYCIVAKSYSNGDIIITFDAEKRVKRVYTMADGKLTDQEWEEIMTRLILINRE
ncbi:J domain-containing protein [Isobaculum melis]|uniref:J domain-containing protein n=1 Tax=Isobaculum melis TaxID=142588 RepID=A0A1H9U8J1_9LACT|nr:hypothetical protein [Isobaculum melis]SES05558.1 hypothetical protein SAMN04488559_12325 [Isobaculum melis]